MHHQDFPGDPPVTGARKSTHNYRRGSGGTSASSTAGAPCVTAEDTSAQAGSSSPALHHQSQASTTQVKKKSGFQITSVTSAQISVSGNNSLADDTESYDDMDESHTEDLSSSDILDVSVPRATDTGVLRSSSDETLNSLHGVETPGLVSPNEHVHAHMSQGPLTHASMVNGINPPFYPLPPHQSEGIPAGDLPTPPIGSSSPTIVSKVGMTQPQRAAVLDNTKPPGGHQIAGDAHLRSGGGTSMAPVLPLAAFAGLDTNVGGEAAVPTSHTHSNPPQTQSTTGSRFRVVKLDTNSEPFRKGRWTCTEYYEKEVPHSVASEVHRGPELLDTELVPHTLQSYQPNQDFSSPPTVQSPPQGVAQATPQSSMGLHKSSIAAAAVISQTQNVLPQQQLQALHPAHFNAGGGQPDFIQPTAPFQTQVQPPLPHMSAAVPIVSTAIQAQQLSQQPPVSLLPPQQPPVGLLPPQQPPVGLLPPQQPPVGLLPQQPPVGLPSQQPPVGLPPQQPPVGLPPQQPPVGLPPQQPPVGLPPQQPPVGLPPQQLPAGLPPQQPPGGLPAQQPLAGAPQQPPVGLPQQLPQQLGALSRGAPSRVAPPPLSVSHSPGVPTQPQPPTLPVTLPLQPVPLPSHGHLPLTALQADLQPLLAPMSPAAGRSSHLEDAHRLLFQHQGLLALPRMGASSAAVEGGGSGAVLGHISAEASALMAAAVGLRGQPADGEDDSSSGASVVAIDNKIEQAMDLVKSHLMYAVREEVEVLKEQIKELIERNSQLEQENTLLKTLASPEQMAQFQAQVQTGGSPTGQSQPAVGSAGTQAALPPSQNMSA